MDVKDVTEHVPDVAEVLVAMQDAKPVGVATAEAAAAEEAMARDKTYGFISPNS